MKKTILFFTVLSIVFIAAGAAAQPKKPTSMEDLTKPQSASFDGFNSFAWGTPIADIKAKLNSDGAYYEENKYDPDCVYISQKQGNEFLVVYNFHEGKLFWGRFISLNADETKIDKYYKNFGKKYGKFNQEIPKEMTSGQRLTGIVQKTDATAISYTYEKRTDNPNSSVILVTYKDSAETEKVNTTVSNTESEESK
jgi:hypothetical protein